MMLSGGEFGTTGRRADGRYDSYVSFYRDVYGHAMREVQTAGRVGATLISAEQQAGDWSDAASPDLVISIVRRPFRSARVDLGSGRFWVTPAAKDEFALIPPHSSTDIVVDTEHSLLLFAAPYTKLVEMAGPDAGLPHDGDFGHLHRGLQRDCDVVNVVKRCWIEAAQGAPHGTLWADGALLQLAAALLRLKNGKTKSFRGGLAPSRLRRALEYLESNLDRDVGLSELAAEIGLSPGHFCTAFKESTGESPHRYLTRRRVERAMDLIASGVPICEAASMAGFASQQHLTTVFRKNVGTTPGAWRQTRKGR